MPETTADTQSTLGEFRSAVVDFCIKYGLRLIVSLIVLVIGGLIIRMISRRILRTKWYAKLDKSIRGFAMAAIKAILYIVILLTVIAILGIPMASVTALIASVGVALSLALQGSLSNLAGGIMLLIFKPFRVGDYIVTKDHEGTVEEIGIFNTSLVTIDKRRIFLPNASLSNSNISNNTYYEQRMVQHVFPVDCDAPIDLVDDILRRTAESMPQRLEDTPVTARFCEFGDSCAKYQVRVWCKTEDYWDLYYSLWEAGKRALTESGVKIPYPIMEVRQPDERKYE